MKIHVNREDLKYIQESIQNGEVLKEDLRRWFKEKWVDVSRKVKGKHPPCGRKDADGKAYPKCRPSKKVSKETPKPYLIGITNSLFGAPKPHLIILKVVS